MAFKKKGKTLNILQRISTVYSKINTPFENEFGPSPKLQFALNLETELYQNYSKKQTKLYEIG